MSRVVGQIRRGLRRAAAGHPDPSESAALRGVGHNDVDNLDDEPVPIRVGAGSGSLDVEGNGDDQDPGGGGTSGAGVSDVDGGDPLTVSPALDNPLSTLWPPAGLGLTGPGADAAARGLLTAALASGGVDHPEARIEAWRRRSNRSSTQTPTVTGRTGRPWTRLRHAGSGAGGSG
nr:hypothetical protein [Micromonospora sp. U21]